jgi:hypothetical protein
MFDSSVAASVDRYNENNPPQWDDDNGFNNAVRTALSNLLEDVRLAVE